LGVTAHWLDSSFVMNSHCLAVRPAPSDNLKAELTKVADEWQLDMSTLHAVTDSGANIKKAMAQLPLQKWRPCFAHTLQLCVNGALSHRSVSELPKVVAKARNIVSHFRRSPLASMELQKAQQQLGLPEHKLLQDCPTRWNSQVHLNLLHAYVYLLIKRK